MYDHPGKVLKGIGVAIFVILLIVTIVGSIPLFGLAQYNGIFVLIGLVEIVIDALLAYLSGLFLAAFGELVENSTTIAYYVRQEKGTNSSYPPSQPVSSGTASAMPVPQPSSVNSASFMPVSSQTVQSPVTAQGVKVCTICGTVNAPNRYACANCGMGLPSVIQPAATANITPSKFKTCPHCGEENCAGDKHCSKCGRQI